MSLFNLVIKCSDLVQLEGTSVIDVSHLSGLLLVPPPLPDLLNCADKQQEAQTRHCSGSNSKIESDIMHKPFGGVNRFLSLLETLL